MLPVPNLDSYNQQVGAIQAQLAKLQQPQPLQIPTPVSAQIPQQIKYVDGIAGAKEYQSKMPPNSSEVIMDKNDDIFYVVSKDANGVSPKRMPYSRFSIEYEDSEEPEYVTKRDLSELETRILNALNRSKAQEAQHE